MGLAVPTAHAGLLPSCGSTGYPFAQFGDSHAYYGFSNNGFREWRDGLDASRRVGRVCINLLDPDWRMFLRSNGASGAPHAQVVFYGLSGNVTGILNFSDFSAAGYTTWQPSSVVLSTLALPLLTQSAQLRLTSAATSGTWQADDVFVDPWASRG